MLGVGAAAVLCTVIGFAVSSRDNGGLAFYAFVLLVLVVAWVMLFVFAAGLQLTGSARRRFFAGVLVYSVLFAIPLLLAW